MLESPDGGCLAIDTALIQQQVNIDSIGRDEQIFANGGIERRIRVFRLPDHNSHEQVRIERQISLRNDRDNAIYIRVTFEDGHYAWSSPIYVFR